MSDEPVTGGEPMAAVYASAARLQRLVPDAVLVGGSAAVYYAGHRVSTDHDHVIAYLQQRFDLVLDALEAEPDWVTNRIRPGRIILGELGDIEAGVRQMIRKHPLEVEVVELPGGEPLRIPTQAETLRIKAFLIVRRNQVRDYLDVAALAEAMGPQRAAEVLGRIDDYYADESTPGDDTVAAQLVRQLADPRPKDHRTTKELAGYKGLDARWHDWEVVVRVTRTVARYIVEAGSS